ncbi:MAG: hypothetical protein KGO82_05985 [Bacteroidota bacterium]|nr:hypothetical protein [Bacteroidota bacterium]
MLPMLLNGQAIVGYAYEQVREGLNAAAEDPVEYFKRGKIRPDKMYKKY